MTPEQLAGLDALDDEGSEIDVPISYEIISLFSEGLYGSHHKAIEELVVNGFDAGAETVAVLIPANSDADGDEPLWIVDDGDGMSADGFKDLWRIADSPKKALQTVSSKGRAPIGQFGIGKLAAYVLAWRLTHVSRDAAGIIRATSMDFRKISGIRQNDPESQRLTLRLHELSLDRAKHLLANVEMRDPESWRLMFETDSSWTAVALTDFRGLYDKLREGTLAWVLRTGLPMTSAFSIRLNGETLVPAVAEREPYYTTTVGGDDLALQVDGVTPTETGIVINGISGEIRGEARLYEQAPPHEGKSTGLGRNNGFFIRVRGRVINLEDELFGIEALNHAVWARFVFEVDARPRTSCRTSVRCLGIQIQAEGRKQAGG